MSWNNISKKGSPDPLKNINVHMLEFTTSTNTFNSIEKDYKCNLSKYYTIYSDISRF